MSAAPITRDDIESKLRELQGEVDETVEQSAGIAVMAGVAAVVGSLAVAYMLGRRRGRKRTTVVEVRRL